MTTIVVEPQRFMVTTDSRATLQTGNTTFNYNINHHTEVDKVWMCENVLITGSGDRDLIEAFAKGYFEGNNNMTTISEHASHMAVVTYSNGMMMTDVYSCGECVSKESTFFKPITTKYNFERTTFIMQNKTLFFGSGSNYAKAAMHLKHPVLEAMRAATELDPYTGGEFKQYQINLITGHWEKIP